MKLHKLKSPNTFLIIFSLIVVMAILTWIIPSGEYQRKEVNGRAVVVNNTFKLVEGNPQGIDDIFLAPIKGFIKADIIIGLIFIVGGAFGIFQKTAAIDAAILGIVKIHDKSRLMRILLIPGLMFLFSFGGATFGMSEEVIPFILIFVPLALMLGYDTITGVAIPFIGAGAGFAAAFLNPFTVGIAQQIADLQPLSGIEYRIICWFVVTLVSVIFVVRYANKVKNNPEISCTYNADIEKRKKIQIADVENFKGLNNRHKAVLLLFLSGLAVLVYGVLKFQWEMEEITAVFLITGIAVGIAAKLTITEITDSFVSGAKDMAATVLVVALARGILIITSDGRIIDTILYYLSIPVSQLHPVISAQAMFLVQTLLNFFVASGSGQAVLTMPIMSPLSDLVHVSRQTAVLAFQFGDGFSNMIIPTSAVTMSVLALAGVPWEKWIKWALPLEIILFLTGMLLLIPPFFFNWQ
jgi:uncharacterized ion transporter superfamily protein YfcC